VNDNEKFNEAEQKLIVFLNDHVAHRSAFKADYANDKDLVFRTMSLNLISLATPSILFLIFTSQSGSLSVGLMLLAFGFTALGAAQLEAAARLEHQIGIWKCPTLRENGVLAWFPKLAFEFHPAERA
jgi:hypothetical protein